MSSADSSVGVVDQVAAGSANTQNVRTITATLWEGGAPKTVQMQVISLADETGDLIPLRGLSDHLQELVHEARMQTAALQLLVGTILDRELTREDLENLADGTDG